MKKVRSPKEIKVKRSMDSSRPSYKSGIYDNPKPVKKQIPGKIGSALDEFKIEEIKLE